MAAEKQDPGFRHPDTVAHSQSLTNEEEAMQRGRAARRARFRDGGGSKGCTQPDTVPFNLGEYLSKRTANIRPLSCDANEK